MSEGGVAAETVSDLRLVKQRGPAWFGSLERPVEARTSWFSTRPQSSVHCISVGPPNSSDGDGWPSVIVKRNQLEEPASRPRLGLQSDFDRKHEFEGAALKALNVSVEVLGRPDFEAVEVLDTLADGLVMTALPGRSLGSMIRQRHGLGAANDVRRAGALLAVFHDVALELPATRSTASDVVDAFDRYRQFIGRSLQALDGRIDALVERVSTDLEDRPPRLGLGHGDFAPRNVLVGDGRVGLIDPLGCQRCPIEEDLAFFALELRRGVLVPWVGPISDRMSDRLEQALLDGYGRERIDPFRYEVLSALVALDALAADAVRPQREESVLRRGLRRSLPPLMRLLTEHVDRALASRPVCSGER